jgi:adenylate kinase
MNLIIFGAPGAGKGTQSAFLTEAYHIPQISTGDILRAQRRAGTPLADQVKGYMDRGELVPDDLMIEIVKHRLEQPDAKRGFILDGFPRTVAQAQALDKMLDQLQRRIDAVIYLRVSRQALMDRLSHRASVERTDDTPEVIANRIDVFLKYTAPLIDYYQAQGKLENVDGQQPIDTVRADIERRLGALKRGAGSR